MGSPTRQRIAVIVPDAQTDEERAEVEAQIEAFKADLPAVYAMCSIEFMTQAEFNALPVSVSSPSSQVDAATAALIASAPDPNRRARRRGPTPKRKQSRRKRKKNKTRRKK